ncbi:MAG: hypothetical protein C0402_10820 [Thermodesulfovibrio sp.]|nr:hypothetical protein [Thermodesulfovibrio sp.]
MEDNAKIYGLCLYRLKYQIELALGRAEGSAEKQLILESYNTSEIDEIIDILEIYDLQEKSPEELAAKLDELAYTVSVLTKHPLCFDYTELGHLGLYLDLDSAAASSLQLSKAA